MSYYEVLGVRRDASTQEIERAFKQLARRFHPDVNAGDREAEPVMKELNLIRATLTDPESRAAYDDKLRKDLAARTAPAPSRAPPAAPPPPPGAEPGDSAFGGLSGAAWMNTARAGAVEPPARRAKKAEAAYGAAAAPPPAAREAGSRFGPAVLLAGIVVGSGLVIGFLLLIRHIAALLGGPR